MTPAPPTQLFLEALMNEVCRQFLVAKSAELPPPENRTHDGLRAWMEIAKAGDDTLRFWFGLVRALPASAHPKPDGRATLTWPDGCGSQIEVMLDTQLFFQGMRHNNYPAIEAARAGTLVSFGFATYRSTYAPVRRSVSLC
jgi:hypothetical protein